MATTAGQPPAALACRASTISYEAGPGVSPGECMPPVIAPTLAPHFCAQPAQPLCLDHSHRLRRLPRWPFLEIAARFHPLAGLPCRPNGRQGSGFDSPWRAAVGTTWFRRRHRYKPLVLTPPPSCR